MIAGPNGAGKTTMIRKFTAHTPPFYEFLNADEIAKGLAPLHPESVALAASKLMIKRLRELLEENYEQQLHSIRQELINTDYAEDADYEFKKCRWGKFRYSLLVARGSFLVTRQEKTAQDRREISVARNSWLVARKEKI